MDEDREKNGFLGFTPDSPNRLPGNIPFHPLFCPVQSKTLPVFHQILSYLPLKIEEKYIWSKNGFS